MKRVGIGASILGALLLLVHSGRSGEQKDLHAILDKAIDFQGAAAKIAKIKAMTMKGAGKFYGLGEGIPYSGMFAHQGLDQMRIELDLNVNNENLKVIVVVNGDKGWMKAADQVMEMSKEELAEEHEGIYAEWVSNLVPLKDPAFKLSPLGEVKVEGQPAIGIRASSKGHRHINLYFDKATKQLVKTERITKDIKVSGDKELTEENFYADYKEFDGLKHPTKVTVKRDGKLFIEATLTEFKIHDKLEKSTFERP